MSDTIAIIIRDNRAVVSYDGETAIPLSEEQSWVLAEALQFALDMARDRDE